MAKYLDYEGLQHYHANLESIHQVIAAALDDLSSRVIVLTYELFQDLIDSLENKLVIISDTNSIYYNGYYINGISENSSNKLSILLNKDGQNYWNSELMSFIEDLCSYGVRWIKGSGQTNLERIGNSLLHLTLPILNSYKGCVVNAETKEINYYLDANDWSKKEDGSDSVLDGSDGQVMVHIPKFYVKSGITEDGIYMYLKMSLTRLSDEWTEVPECFISAYHPTVNNNTFQSVVNYTPDFRGGPGDRDSYDLYYTFSENIFRTDLGKPRTMYSMSEAKVFAENINASVLTFLLYTHYIWIPYLIEYANTNIQESPSDTLTSEGFKQGGLGKGVTYCEVDGWANFNDSYPLIPMGYTNSLGNLSGTVRATMPSDWEGLYMPDYFVPRWRGFENVFGHISTMVDGIYISQGYFNETWTSNIANIMNSDGNYFSTQEFYNSPDIYYSIDASVNPDLGILPVPGWIGGEATLGLCDYCIPSPGNTIAVRPGVSVGGSIYLDSGAGISTFDYSDNFLSGEKMRGTRFIITL